MSNEQLETKVWKLAHTVVDAVTKLKSEGKISKSKVPHFSLKLEKFEYKEGIKGYQMSHTYSEKEEWNIVEEHRFFEKIVKPLPQYAEVVTFLSKAYRTTPQQANYWLSTFCHHVIRTSIDKKIIEEDFVELVTTFIRDLEGSAKEWSPIVWLNGVWLKSDELALQEGIEIRRPKPSDIEREFERRVDYLPFWSAFPPELPSAILGMKYRAKTQSEVHDEIGRILTTLRLYKVGSVTNIRTKWRSKTILGILGTTFGTRFLPSYKYGIGLEDLDSLQKFMEIIKSLIPIEALRGRAETVDYVTIALRRYSDSLLKPDVVEAKLTSAIMCLESLYLKTAEREELSHRLAQRVSRLLTFLDHNPLEVYNLLKQAYGMRSKYIHGSQLEKEERQTVGRVTETVINYARQSVVLFLQLRQKIEKEKFLNLIDNSLLSEKASQKLKNQIKNATAIM